MKKEVSILFAGSLDGDTPFGKGIGKVHFKIWIKIVYFIQYMLVAWHSGRTSVSDWQTFPVLHSTCS